MDYNKLFASKEKIKHYQTEFEKLGFTKYSKINPLKENQKVQNLLIILEKEGIMIKDEYDKYRFNPDLRDILSRDEPIYLKSQKREIKE